MIRDADLSKMSQEVDLRTLEKLLQNITYANVDREELEQLGDDNFIKLFKLSQMSIEYLIYTQNYLECLTRTLDLQYKSAVESTKGARERIQQYNSMISNLKKENTMKQQTLSTYDYLFRIP
jgi:zinc finger protein DZIP1